MSTTTSPVVAIPAVSAPAPKVSWLKRVGQVLGSILKIVAKDAAPAADTASKVAAIMFPQFAPGIIAADNLIDNIAKEAVTAEAMDQAAATAKGGPAKLQAVLASVGPLMDQWVANKFPGSTAVSNASKAGLVSAVVAIVNEVSPPPIGGTPAAK
jgi:hypothetical protein